ncbi:MAG TPA: 1-deoxy-D-xylulose-5-phosphate reductoisomerase [Candidatus Scybalocola faecigallinarum]|uniref:1-deoxy-D-xylulose 5-phosphate reductoisomerase n=1 Tax=Candidatus Scybalocola faecigallinarum TaxID=2840941 RepID=A0A9D1F6Z9_9FIRM|nr:1-deoxy-D-xylulose-5-phosphate reductoisomerase [Candidatus Scybalocola faecigallinarum]
MKYISILGSTGSIGTQTLDIVENNKDLCVRGLAAGRNVELLEQQIRRFSPVIAALWDEKDAADLRVRVADLPVKIVSGMDGLIQVVTEEKTQIVVTAIVGMIGIRPTMEAIMAEKDIALANKETLVTAGHLIMPLAKKHGVQILPVDSEHSAIFQCLQGFEKSKVRRILLTASGGPFRTRTRESLKDIQVEDALKHPNWVMGRKITIDSATMVNKGLEVMEARWLFNVGLDQIQVVVHPQSIIHSAVEYVDGAVIAQLGTPDMRLPIQYALFYPKRRFLNGQPLDLFQVGAMTFEPPRLDVFEGLALAYEAARAGGSMPTVFNAANERAVAKFLNREIGFLDIVRIIRQAMEHHQVIVSPDLDQILMTEQQTYDFIESRW